MAPMTWLGSSAALAILSFDVDAESAILAEGRQYAEHPSAMSHQRYGPLVGVPRILGLLEELSVPATFFVPGWTAERYPETVERILAAGHEIGHHGHGHRSPLRMTRPKSGRTSKPVWRRSTASAFGRRAIARRAGSRARARSTSSPSTASTTTRRSWTTTSRTCSRRRRSRWSSCPPTGASTTGTSTCTSPIRGPARARCTRRRGRSGSGRRSWTACAVTAACSA